MNAQIVVGLGFGDEGKGITTDYLCSKNENSLVVRFSGGQQCGHNVCIGDKQHVHSNFGSGTLRGVPSFFSEHCTIYPNTMFEELRLLESKNILPTLYLHPLAKITTPYDVLANILSERKNRHGSCGLGVGATMKRDLAGYKLLAIDLRHTSIFSQKLNELKKYYAGIFDYTDSDLTWLEAEVEHFLNVLPLLKYSISDYSLLKNKENIIFEGSQGIMLDQNHGIFPHVTYANTTSKNAVEICDKIGIEKREIFYVTRCYSTRHGNGWMPRENIIELVNNQFEINTFNKHQGNFRIGEIDYELLNFALEIDGIYAGNIEKNLVITCLDQRKSFNFDYFKIKTPMKNYYESYSPDSEHLKIVK